MNTLGTVYKIINLSLNRLKLDFTSPLDFLFLKPSVSITEDVIMDRIFKYFNRVANDNINQEEWVLGFNIFMKGSEDEMTRFCFEIYDLNDDGYISKEEMLLLMKDCMYKHVKEANEDEGDDGVKVKG